MKNKLKRILLISILTTLGMVFTGCSEEVPVLEKTTIDKNLVFTDGIFYDTSKTIDDEYYMIINQENPHIDYGIPFLSKIDSSGNITPVCNLENCSHDSMSCNANSNVISGRVLNYEGVNYFIGEKNENGYRTGVLIETFEDNNFKDATNIYSRSSHLLASLDVVVHNNWMIYSSSDYSKGYTKNITGVNLETKETEIFVETDDDSRVIGCFSVVQDNLIYSVSERHEESWYTSNPKWELSVKSLDLNTGREATITRFVTEEIESAHIQDEFLYTVEEDMYIYKTNLYTLQRELILDLASVNKTFDMSYGHSFHIDDSHMYYYIDGENTRYTLNLNNLESKEQTFDVMGRSGDFERYMNVIGSFDDGNYLVVGDYSTGDSLSRHFYIVKKEDYWNNKENFQHIGLLNQAAYFEAYFTPGY